MSGRRRGSKPARVLMVKQAAGERKTLGQICHKVKNKRDVPATMQQRPLVSEGGPARLPRGPRPAGFPPGRTAGPTSPTPNGTPAAGVSLDHHLDHLLDFDFDHDLDVPLDVFLDFYLDGRLDHLLDPGRSPGRSKKIIR